MANLGEYVYVYGVVGTQYANSGEVRGYEYTTQLQQLIEAGYMILWTGARPGEAAPSSSDFTRFVSAHELNLILESRIGTDDSGKEIGYCIYTDQFTATTDSWETIPGFELAFPTASRPVYLTLDLGLVAVEGVSEQAASISYRILDVQNQIPLRTGYVTADRRLTAGGAEYLLAESTPITVRLEPNRPDLRYIVQVQVPNDQLGPAWYFNVSWAQGIDLRLKAITA